MQGIEQRKAPLEDGIPAALFTGIQIDWHHGGKGENHDLKLGAGQYMGSSIIGYGGTTMICAHVNKQFANLHNVEVGDTVQIRTAYGVYIYEVKYVGVHKASDKTVYDLAREDENVVMYTCYYQMTALGSVKMRYFVCADLVSGPMIVDGGGK